MGISSASKQHHEFFENFTSLHTRKAYQTDLELFLAWIKEKYQISQLAKIERKHVVDYRNYLTTAEPDGSPACAPKTIARKLAALSSFFDYLVEKDLLTFNPATSVKRPRRDVTTPTQALNREQVENLFRAIDANKKCSHLHRALLITFFTTGLRKAEILQLKFKHYREINEYKVIEYLGKGGKIGQKVLHPQCVQAIEDYLSWMRSLGRTHSAEDWLFQPTHNPANPQNLNKPLNPRTINEIIDYYALKIGLNFKISPHSARATFISELLELGVDIYSVAREVNHASVKTTQEYDKRRKKLLDSPVFRLRYGGD